MYIPRETTSVSIISTLIQHMYVINTLDLIDIKHGANQSLRVSRLTIGGVCRISKTIQKAGGKGYYLIPSPCTAAACHVHFIA